VENNLIIINKCKNRELKVVLFDFDGTISTLRYGWQKIMESMMVEMLSNGTKSEYELHKEINNYIEDSTGIQTIYQMKWLEEKIEKYKTDNSNLDCWDLKNIYNEKLKNKVNNRVKKIKNGISSPDRYIVKGSKNFLAKLKENDYELILFSGTDHPDVVEESKILGVYHYFNEIQGAPPNRFQDSKEYVFNKLIKERKIPGKNLLVIGDGKVEISLGAKKGAVTLGMATSEESNTEINNWKKDKLIEAGADAITGDFSKKNQIFSWLNLNLQ